MLNPTYLENKRKIEELPNFQEIIFTRDELKLMREATHMSDKRKAFITIENTRIKAFQRTRASIIASLLEDKTKKEGDFYILPRVIGDYQVLVKSKTNDNQYAIDVEGRIKIDKDTGSFIYTYLNAPGIMKTEKLNECLSYIIVESTGYTRFETMQHDKRRPGLNQESKQEHFQEQESKQEHFQEQESKHEHFQEEYPANIGYHTKKSKKQGTQKQVTFKLDLDQELSSGSNIVTERNQGNKTENNKNKPTTSRKSNS